MKILIEPGHGYNTPGKCSPDKRLLEWQWNRATAKIVVERLKNFGYDVEQTVTEDIDISLKERAERVNAYCDKLGKDNVIFVSVHVNAAGGDGKWHNAKGWSVWTTEGKTKSDELAEAMYRAAEYRFPDRTRRSDMSDGDHDFEYPFYVLRHTKCPAVLVENFFMDTKEEMEFLLTDDAKSRCADVIIDGIVYYLQNQK